MDRYLAMKYRVFEIIEKAQNEDRASKFVDIVILSLIILNTISIVLESFNSLYTAYHIYFRRFEVISVFVFTVEYIMRVWTSDLLYPKYHNKFKAKARYMLSWMALIDLLAILPFYLPMLIRIDLRFLRLFRVSRLMRILKINRYTKALSIIMGVIRDKKEELLGTIFVMGFMIMISSTMMYHFESEVQPEAFPNIVASFWWSIATLTTVGYGDIYPVTGLGKLFASIIAILGIGLVALPTGIISSGFIELIGKKNDDDSTIICPHCGEKIKRE